MANLLRAVDQSLFATGSLGLRTGGLGLRRTGQATDQSRGRSMEPRLLAPQSKRIGTISQLSKFQAPSQPVNLRSQRITMGLQVPGDQSFVNKEASFFPFEQQDGRIAGTNIPKVSGQKLRGISSQPRVNRSSIQMSQATMTRPANNLTNATLISQVAGQSKSMKESKEYHLESKSETYVHEVEVVDPEFDVKNMDENYFDGLFGQKDQIATLQSHTQKFIGGAMASLAGLMMFQPQAAYANAIAVAPAIVQDGAGALAQGADAVAKGLTGAAPALGPAMASNPLAAVLATIGAGGVAWLGVAGHQQRMEMLKNPELAEDLFSDTVKYRLQSTLAYFGSSLLGTGAFCYALRDSPIAFALAAHPFWYLGGSLALLFATMAVDYEENWLVKNLLYTTWVGLTSASLVPLLAEAGGPIIEQAVLATSLTVGSLGVVAATAPSQQFLFLGGPLSIGLGGLIGTSIIQSFNPGLEFLDLARIYGGVGVFSLFILYDVQMILERAKSEAKFDPINRSIDVYLDAINLFIKFLEIYMRSSSKSKRDD